MKRKSNILVFAALILAVSFLMSSCGRIIIINDGKETEPSEDTTAPATEPVTSDSIDKSPTLEYIELAKSYLAALPQQNFGGAEILVSGIGAEKFGGVESGTIMGLNRGKRNSAVEQALNLKFSFSEVAEDILFEDLSLLMETGEGSKVADLLILPVSLVGKYAEAGLLYDLSKLNCDFATAPYFDSDATAKSGGAPIYAVVGDATNDPDYTYVMFFNKTVAGKLGLGDLYTIAGNGEWTFDKFLEFMNVAKSAEGLGIEDLALCGSPDEAFIDAMYIGGGHYLFDSLPGQTPTAHTPTKEDEEYVTAIGALIKDGYKREGEEFDPAKKFMDGEMLFYVAPMSASEYLSTAGVDWGVLPIPKKNVEQDKYRCLASDDMPVLAVPANADPKQAEALINAIFAASYKFLATSYAENQMSYFLRDSRAVDMVYMLTGCCVYDSSTFYKSLTAVSNISSTSLRAAVRSKYAYYTLGYYTKQHLYTAGKSLEFLAPVEEPDKDSE